MSSPVGLNLWNPSPIPSESVVEALKQEDPRALVQCLRQHRSEYIPFYHVLLDNPAVQRDDYARTHFGEALVYASMHLLPAIVEKILNFPLSLPAPINVHVFSALPNQDFEHIGENGYSVHQFGFEEAICVAICEGNTREKALTAERIVTLILEYSLRASTEREQTEENDPQDYFLNNSGPSDCDTGYLETSLREAQQLGNHPVVAKLTEYIDTYGVSPDEEIEEKFSELKEACEAGRSVDTLSDKLCELLEQKRYRFLPSEILSDILDFAIKNRRNDLIPVILQSEHFVMWDPDKTDFIRIISLAIAHLSSKTIRILKGLLDEDYFRELLESYCEATAQNPIATTLEVYLACREMQDCPNPVVLLNALFEFDSERSDDSSDDLQEIIMSLKDAMDTQECLHDKEVWSTILEYRNVDLSTSDSDEDEDN